MGRAERVMNEPAVTEGDMLIKLIAGALDKPEPEVRCVLELYHKIRSAEGNLIRLNADLAKIKAQAAADQVWLDAQKLKLEEGPVTGG